MFAVGNALVDLQVEVDDAFLSELDVPKGTMGLVEQERQRDVLASLTGRPVHRCSGGSAANTVAGIAELGGSAAFCGRVAEDDHGAFYRADLRKLGVRVSGLSSTTDTGTCAVLITPDAQRTMLTHLGASSELSADDVQPEALEGAAYAYVEGYLLTGDTTREAALKTIELATEAGVKVALTASDPFVVSACRDLVWQLVEGPVDLLFCNELEAKALTEKDDPIDSAHELHRHAANVALTLGANGSLLMHDGEVHPIEGVPVRAVDTTGAGDMFAAGILHGITSGMSWPQAGRLASHAAARIVEQLGARLPRPFTDDELRALVEQP